MSTVYDRFRTSALQRGDADFLCVEEVTAANYGIEAQTISWCAASEREIGRASCRERVLFEV